jgi:molybdopterin synthase catalytic subunit
LISFIDKQRLIFGILILFSSCIGITRDNFDGRRVSRLSYEAYEPMALQELNRLCDDARQQFVDIEHIAICHRLGLALYYHYFVDYKCIMEMWI